MGSLSPDEPHGPASHEDSANKHAKTIQAVADLVAGRVALGNSEYDRGKKGKYQRRAEVGKSDGRHYGFFPIAI